MISEIVMNGADRDGMLSLKGITVLDHRRHRRATACSFLLVAFLICNFAVSAFAADPTQIYQESTDALYSLDFSTAQHGFESLTRDYPDNPDYWNAMASSIWLKIMYDQQKLNIESFSGRGSFGTKESRDAISPTDEKALRETIGIAIAKANVLLKKNPKDIRGLYALGVANATLASFEASAKRSYLSAHAKAKTARSLHQQVLQLDPSFHDARLAVGTYDYVVGVIPGFFRMMLGFFGVRGGGKEAGIVQLETAAAKAKSVNTDARMLLVVIYNREKKFDAALRYINELHHRYPRNFLFELAEASIYGKMKRWDDAERVYERILMKVQGKQDGYERVREGRVMYQLATTHVERLQFDKAMEFFTRTTLSKDSPPDEKASAYLWLGKMYDSKNERAKALQQYDAILALNCDSEVKSEAQKYKKTPYKA
jgi:TolA-binding protein